MERVVVHHGRVSTPTPADAATPSPAGASGERRRPNRLSVANMVRSMGLLLLVVLFVVVFQERGGQRVHVVDPTQTYIGAAREADFTVLTPHGLSAGWRCTDARNQAGGSKGTLWLHVGYVTPSDNYAELLETTSPRSSVFAHHLGAEPVVRGTVRIGGASWQRYASGKHGQPALARTARVGGHTVTYLVTGGAGPAELRTLAGSLAPYHEAG